MKRLFTAEKQRFSEHGTHGAHHSDNVLAGLNLHSGLSENKQVYFRKQGRRLSIRATSYFFIGEFPMRRCSGRFPAHEVPQLQGLNSRLFFR